jgi:hypothetical protein
VQPSKCPAGSFVSSQDELRCEPCASGTFSPTESINVGACTHDKSAPEACGAGLHFDPEALISRTRDDWVCVPCPVGFYSSGDAAADAGDQCLAKGKQKKNASPPTTAPTTAPTTDPTGRSRRTAAKSSPSNGPDNADPEWCPPGYIYNKGTSLTRNDWGCVMAPRLDAMCVRTTQTDAKSTLTGFATGMPERVLPFLKTLTASIKPAGYQRVEAVAEVFVVGRRFISDLERLPMPEGRPLLVVHDPPGGASFVSFSSVRVQSRITDSMKEETVGWSTEHEINIGKESAQEAPEVVALVCSPGMCLGNTQKISDAPMVEVDLHAGPTFSYSEDRTSGAISVEAQGASAKRGKENPFANEKEVIVDALEYTFTYQTSNGDGYIGGVGDAMLMPALTFEVRKMWAVTFNAVGGAGTMTTRLNHQTPQKLGYHAAKCIVVGRTDKTLVARPTLSAFWFIQTNDVETRVMPVLKEVAGDLKQRKKCKEREGGCCSAIDIASGCEEDRISGESDPLKSYCAWKHHRGKIPNSDACANGGCVEFHACQEIEAKLQHLADKEDDVDNPAYKAIRAFQDWVNTLDRNYRKNAAVAAGSGAATVVRYREYDASQDDNLSPGTAGDATVGGAWTDITAENHRKDR